jgi:hypothetical protein
MKSVRIEIPYLFHSVPIRRRILIALNIDRVVAHLTRTQVARRTTFVLLLRERGRCQEGAISSASAVPYGGETMQAVEGHIAIDPPGGVPV